MKPRFSVSSVWAGCIAVLNEMFRIGPLGRKEPYTVIVAQINEITDSESHVFCQHFDRQQKMCRWITIKLLGGHPNLGRN